ncbi:MAG: endonuclease [Candidatus Thermoplasmatota archaeon]|nr:endonuclease [Candidatus Thermoplasmatota archaeon]
MTMQPTYIYKILYKKYGKQNWWPVDKRYHKKNDSDYRFEIIVGAILTQNTAWSNVEKAIINLKKNNMLNIETIIDANLDSLKEIIKPSGFFNQKAKRLQTISNYLKNNYNSNLDKFFNREIKLIRNELLSLNGIGPETADSILLYAGNKPVFVVDAYTKRLCERIPFKTKLTYDYIQNFFEKDLKKNFEPEELVDTYNEFHALIVKHAKDYCKKKPNCNNCLLNKKCNFYKNLF